MTVENDQFRAFFRMVPQKLAFSGKRGRFRAKSQEIKVVGKAILKDVYSITFFLQGVSKKSGISVLSSLNHCIFAPIHPISEFFFFPESCSPEENFEL